jgi:hypothetical protein
MIGDACLLCSWVTSGSAVTPPGARLRGAGLRGAGLRGGGLLLPNYTPDRFDHEKTCLLCSSVTPGRRCPAGAAGRELAGRPRFG